MTSSHRAEVPFTEQEAAQLRDDGFVHLREVLPPDALDPVRATLTRVVDRFAREWLDEGLIDDPFDEAPFDTRWALIRQQLPALRPVTWRRVLVSPAMHSLWTRPELTGRMSGWLGEELWAHHIWNGRPREPHAPVQKIHWHQDAYYLKGWEPSDGHVLTCWIPLVPATAESGCLQIIAGSHRFGVLPRKHDQYMTRRVAPGSLPEGAVHTLEASPGDVVVFTERTVHQALHNLSNLVRWTVDIRFGKDGDAMRRKAVGGFLCRSANRDNVDSYDTWAAKYDVHHGALAEELRTIDKAAQRAGPMARDITPY